MTDKHGDVRREYDSRQLQRESLDTDPLRQFEHWLAEAQAADLVDATAMSLATADGQGQPSVRIVLLKHHDAAGFVFYTDYRSQKGRELAANPQASVLFYWRELERQVRINGAVEQVARADSQAYFASRPLESQISASASEQSAVIESRQALAAKADRVRETPELQAPEPWGGYRLVPREYEFWQGRENRLHDRFRYTQKVPADGQATAHTGAAWGDWLIQRLQP